MLSDKEEEVETRPTGTTRFEIISIIMSVEDFCLVARPATSVNGKAGFPVSGGSAVISHHRAGLLLVT